MSKGGLCDLFTDTESQPHFVITQQTLPEFFNNLHFTLNAYLAIVTGGDQDRMNSILGMLETSLPTFNIIHKCIQNPNASALSAIEKRLLINLSRAIIYDTEHDFGSGTSRGNCNNGVIKVCLSSFEKLKNKNGGGRLINLNEYATGFFSNNRDNAWFNGITTFNDCVDPANPDSVNKDAIKNLSDIKYYLQDSAVHKKAKTAFLMSGGKTIYRAISTAIDPAGCKNEKANEFNVADHVNINYESLILNISLIFYQNFYTICQHLKKMFYIEIPSDRTLFKNDKRFNINIINLNDGVRSQIHNVIGGSNCNYSPQKICNILTTKKSSMDKLLEKYYLNIPLNDVGDYLFTRALQLILKGHGDFGQIFWSTFLYHTPNSKLPHDFYLEIPNVLPPKFYNNCLIQTGDKYFACISAILEAPVLIGTTGNISMYIINSNIKYYNQNIIHSYNAYNDLKFYDTIAEGMHNFMAKIASISQSEETIIESIINENAYNKYYDDNIKRFFITKNEAGPFTLFMCDIKDGGVVISYSITDINYWKIGEADWITNGQDYTDATLNQNAFDLERSVVKDPTYYDLVNIKIFSSYSSNFILINLGQLISTAHGIIDKLNNEKAHERGSEVGDIYGKTIDYIYFIIHYGLQEWITQSNGSLFEGRQGAAPPPRIRSIIANNKTFENINNNLKILIKFSEVIENLLNVMYQNLNLLNDLFTRIYALSYNNEHDKLLLYTKDIVEVYHAILNNDSLNIWKNLISEYIQLSMNKFPFNDQFRGDENINNQIFKNEIVKLNSNSNIEKINTPDESIIYSFVKDFGNNISILSSSCLLIEVLRKKLKNLSSEIHTKLIDTVNSHLIPPQSPLEPPSPIERTQSRVKQWLEENQPEPDPDAHQLPAAEATYSQSLDTIYEMTNPDKKECIEYCEGNECTINTTNDDMNIYLTKYIDNISVLYANFNYHLENMKTVTGPVQMHYIAPNMQIAYEEIYRRLTLIYYYRDIQSSLDNNFINYINSVTEYISKQHFQNIIILMNCYINSATLVENNQIMAYGLLNIFLLPEIRGKHLNEEQVNIIIKKKIKEMIYYDFKINYNDNKDDLKVKSLVEDDVEDDGDSTFNVAEWLGGHAGGSLYGISKNNSNKLKIYLKNIENITEKIKLLKKNKIKNKDKIKQENNNIKKLKLKIKKESKKEKEKERKQKEKEKQRKQKIIQKEKHKKEIKIEKQRKEKEKEKTKQKKQKEIEKEKEKTKQKKQKEIEKEKEKQKKEINKNKEKEKQTKQKEKQKKEIEKEKQRKQKIIQKEKQKKEIEKQRKEKEKEKEKTKQKTKQKETLKTKKETKKIKIKIIKNI